MGLRTSFAFGLGRNLLTAAVGLGLVSCSFQQTGEAASTAPRLKPAARATQRRSSDTPVPNSIFLHAKTTEARPVTISRVFASGDISHCAQAVFNGNHLPTQCDVRTRWPDGSLQHALLSFWITPTEGTNEVSFVDHEPAGEGAALPAEKMLSSDYDFGARMELTANGNTLEADARKMLQSGAFRYWLHGPICTQVIIEDRSEKLEYDLGWGDRKPFHPMFLATFYPGWKGVKVDLIGEVTWTDMLEDLTYSLAVEIGPSDNSQTVFEKSDFTHFLGTRWRRTFWSGPELPATSVDLNLAYMIHSRVLPNFDVSKAVPNSAVEASYQAYLKGDRGDLGGNAVWVKYFPTSGGRGDIGLFPSWFVQYLYTFDPRLLDLMLNSANASGGMPAHFRERTKRPYLRDSEVSAFGRILSIEARPTLWVSQPTHGQSRPQDRMVFTGAHADSGWTIDLAHQAGFVFLPYIVTGDYFLLEELQFWGAYDVADANFGDCWYCRHGDWGYINGQTRGNAWGLRTVAHAAFATPDGTPEKTYFMDKVYRNIAVIEGIADVRAGAFTDESPDSPWSFGRNTVAFGMKNPLRYMDVNNNSGEPPANRFNVDPNSPDRVTRHNAPWQYNFEHIVLGHMEELGMPTGPLRSALGTHLIRQLTDPSLNPFLVANYLCPVFNSDRRYYSTWQSYRNAWNAELFAARSWPEKDDADVEHGYPHIARAATSFLTGVCDGEFCGTEAWNWIDRNVGFQDKQNENPKWAILPRTVQGGDSLQVYARKRLQLYKPKSAPRPNDQTKKKKR